MCVARSEGGGGRGQGESSHVVRIIKRGILGGEKNLLVSCENHLPSHNRGSEESEESMKFLNGSMER